MVKSMIQQGSGERTCAGCVAAMITGETLDDVYEYMGSFHTPFQTARIFAYLLSRGIFPGYCVNSLYSQRDTENRVTGYQLGLSITQPAYVVVDVAERSTPHAIFWDGCLVWDPHFSDPTPNLEDYKIVSWTPLYIPGESLYKHEIGPKEGIQIEDLSTVIISNNHPRRMHPGPPCPITIVR